MSDQAGASPFAVSLEEAQRVRDLLYARTGMWFGEAKHYYIERRLSDRIAATGARDVGDYLRLVRSDRLEAERLISSFTVNETYFYRESHQFQCLVERLLPELVESRQPGDRIRIWSQPCSTGEEAYSIALWLLENWRLVDAYNVEIVGSDLDGDALLAAQAARYGPRALARLPDSVLEGYFEPMQRHRRRLIEDLRESVTFTQANLVDADSMRAHGRFDVIFCRNVLIYFDEASRALAAEHLFEGLRPGGFLCLGHTESMSRISDKFALRRFPEAIVYQRPVR